MGEAEIILRQDKLIIHSVICCYGDAASETIAAQIAENIQFHWNEPKSQINFHNHYFLIEFDITGMYEPGLDPEQVWYNNNPRFNFFRIEEFAAGDISFVDGLGCNTGYFKLNNLLQTSTTAAHEYGHTLGLEHPVNLDIRGKKQPGIMYPRGTLVDPEFQYDPTAKPGEKGGTLNPAFRKVLQEDIEALFQNRLSFSPKGLATIGHFSSLYHEKHTRPVNE